MWLTIEREDEGSCGIVYCVSQDETEKVASFLREHGTNAGAYHAGMADMDRSDVQTRWMNDDLRVVVATNAFGMGIDKSDVRWVVQVVGRCIGGVARITGNVA